MDGLPVVAGIILHYLLEKIVIKVIVHRVSPLQILIKRIWIVPIGERHGGSFVLSEFSGTGLSLNKQLILEVCDNVNSVYICWTTLIHKAFVKENNYPAGVLSHSIRLSRVFPKKPIG
jgi:hypothetical protein